MSVCAEAAGESPLQQQTCRDERVRLLTCDQLVGAFQAKAAAAAAAAAGTAAASDTDQVRQVILLRG